MPKSIFTASARDTESFPKCGISSHCGMPETPHLRVIEACLLEFLLPQRQGRSPVPNSTTYSNMHNPSLCFPVYGGSQQKCHFNLNLNCIHTAESNTSCWNAVRQKHNAISIRIYCTYWKYIYLLSPMSETKRPIC